MFCSQNSFGGSIPEASLKILPWAHEYSYEFTRAGGNSPAWIFCRRCIPCDISVYRAMCCRFSAMRRRGSSGSTRRPQRRKRSLTTTAPCSTLSANSFSSGQHLFKQYLGTIHVVCKMIFMGKIPMKTTIRALRNLIGLAAFATITYQQSSIIDHTDLQTSGTFVRGV